MLCALIEKNRNLGWNILIFILLYADDIVLSAELEEEPQKMVENLEIFAKNLNYMSIYPKQIGWSLKKENLQTQENPT